MARRDPHSFHDPDQPTIASFALRGRVDFAARRMGADVQLSLAAPAPAAGPLDLDTRDLTIEAVTDDDDRALPFELSPPDPIRGVRLRVQLRAGTTGVRVRYATAPEASALQWLDAPQTAGGRHPFLFSQCQAIHARSVLPLQDTPRVRLRYTVELEVPVALRALCAAAFVERRESGALAVERFRMDQPVPSYLFAFAVGHLDCRDVGPRSRVWAEPELVERAAWEFAGVETMIATAERLFGPYLWERFDILTMPPSFPYGGMENPRLTFLTPTLLAGDRSLVNVVAHELAHSWTGNLVTNASAGDFWLNEGFTVFAERRILEAIEGEEVARLHAALGRRELDRAIADFADRPELQKLQQDLEGIHPDEAFSVVPYEKGYLFLRTLEEAAGRDAFSALLRRYVSHFAFRSLTSEDFVAFLEEHMPGLATRVDAERWLHAPGIPDNAPPPRSTRLESIERLGTGMPSEEEGRARSPAEWHLHLESLPRPYARCAELDERFHLTASRNYEILVAWLELAAVSGHAPALARIEEVLGEVGRMKYLKPLYIALARTPEGKPLAASCFRRCRAGYHPIARMVVESILRSHGVPISDVNPVALGRR